MLVNYMYEDIINHTTVLNYIRMTFTCIVHTYVMGSGKVPYFVLL